jgi:putative Holliday junction resolvase
MSRVDSTHTLFGFDFGTRRIGVAIGDTLTRTARALTTLHVQPLVPWHMISSLVGDYTPQQLIVGVPYNMDGSPTTLTTAAFGFAQELRQRLRLDVICIDERLSSHEAQSQLRGARAAGRRTRRVTHADVDGVAASIVLQRWFDGEPPLDPPVQPTTHS